MNLKLIFLEKNRVESLKKNIASKFRLRLFLNFENKEEEKKRPTALFFLIYRKKIVFSWLFKKNYGKTVMKHFIFIG